MSVTIVENVVNDLLNYNNLKIVQCNDYFNFSLDSVLLPNFVKITPTIKSIIDLGTGNAPIPMILSTKVDDDVKLIGVEIQKEIYQLAQQSLKINKLEKRISVLNIDMKDIFNYFDTDSFDVVTSNPPYFKNGENSIKNLNAVKSIARHEIMIDIDAIINISKKILKNKGSLYMVHRTERFIEIINKLKENNLEPKRVQFIYPKINKESNLFLIQAVKNGKSGLKLEQPLIIHNNDGSYKEEIIKLFGDEIDDTKKL